MNITINGEATQVQSARSIAELIAELGFQGKRIAVERNGDVVPRTQHTSTPLQENDQIEIVVAVGGG